MNACSGVWVAGDVNAFYQASGLFILVVLMGIVMQIRVCLGAV